MNRFKTFRMLAIAVTLAVWVLSLMPLNQVAVPGGDKLHHLLAYATLMLIWGVALSADTKQPKRAHAVAATLLVGMGITIECLQGLTPYRFFEWTDMAANAIGVAIGWALAALYWLAMRRRPTQTGA